SGRPQSGSHKPRLIRELASGQGAWTLPLAIGATLQRPLNSPAPPPIRRRAPSSARRLAPSSGFIKSSARLAPVNGSRSRWIMLLNCLPRRVERRKTALAPVLSIGVAISIGENRARPSAVGKYWVLLPAGPIFSQSLGPPHWIWSP